MDTKNYELAYLLSPSLAEGEVLTRANKLSILIEEAKGIIRKSEQPRRRRLAYPVNKQKEAYFGWMTFSLAREEMPSLEKKLKGEGEILRYLVVEEEVEKRPPLVLRTIPSRPARSRPPATPKREIEPEEKLDLEALDKKLEEILGK